MSHDPHANSPDGNPRAGRRPGSMTMAMEGNENEPSGPLVLRLGFIRDGKIVEERIIRKRETVSVGSAERNHFIIAGADLPGRFDLFQLVGDAYILNFTDSMSGRLGLPGGVQDFDQLRASGVARNAGAYWQVMLNEESRGKIVIGDTTILFQFVVAPPASPRPQLPPSARGGVVQNIDWLFTTFVATSFMLFFGFIVWLEEADFEIAQGVDQLPAGLQRMILEEPPIPPPEVTEIVEGEAESESDEGEAEPEQSSERRSSSSRQRATTEDSGGGETNAERTARLREEARAQAMALALGAVSGGVGSAFDNLRQGAAAEGSADVIAQSAGVGVADGSSVGGSLGPRSGGGDGASSGRGIGDIGGTSGGTMAASEGAPVQERRVGQMRIAGGGDVGGSGQFDQGTVSRRIRALSSAIKRCYERELSRNPTLAGTVKVRFTITPSGSLTGVSAAENTVSPAVGACVVGVVRRLRFSPGPTGGSVTYQYPFVFRPGA